MGGSRIPRPRASSSGTLSSHRPQPGRCTTVSRGWAAAPDLSPGITKRRQAQWRGLLTGVGPCEENELAIERTVAGGTSPTAVTFLPPIMVEYTDDEPSRVDSSVTVCSSAGSRVFFVSI